MVLNALARPQKWDFEVPNVNNLMAPIQGGIDRYTKQAQTAVENERADEQLGMQRTRLGMEQSRAAKADESERLTRLGKAAAAVHQMPDGPDKAARAKALIDGHADLAPQFQRYGINNADPVGAVGLLAQSWGEYDPLAVRAKEAQIAQAQASTNLTNAQAGVVGLTDTAKEYLFAKKNGFTGTIEDWKKQNVNTNASQNLTWGVDGQGNYVPMQATRDGRLVPSQAPAGVQALPPEELAARKAESVKFAEASAQGQIDLPAVETNAILMKDAINSVRNEKNLDKMTGYRGYLPNVSTDARNIQAKIDQVQGKAFLQAYAGLRGGGAITEAEGAKATASISRLQEMRVGTPEFRQALNDVEKEVNALVDLARRKAQARVPRQPLGGQPAPAQAAPPTAPAAAPQASAQQGAPVRVNSPQEAAALPPGTRFIGHDGIERVKR